MLRHIQKHRFLSWFAAALLLTAVVFQIAKEADEGRLENVDKAVLEKVAEWRSPRWTIFFIDMTALGSFTLITMQTAVAFVLLISAGRRKAALHIASASGGAGALIEIAKAWIERPRPAIVPGLIEVTGYSFPSGHAFASSTLYITLAIVALRRLPRRRQRVAAGATAAILIFIVSLSRVYLGVHYLTDALTGLVLGTAWALFVADMFGGGRQRGSRQESPV